jgi:predicted secreted Zn-dependent protease
LVRLLGTMALLQTLLIPVLAEAQNSVRWTTNYYTVTGATVPEIRQSMRQNRPWKERLDLDGMTDWKVAWHFGVTATANGCRCSSFGTQTTITVTMPRWFPPTNAPDTVKQIWQKYAVALAQHEAGHGAIALAAAAEVQRRIQAIGESADCASLRQQINALGHQVVEDHRKRDQEYDASTRHGATQGASLPGRGRRERVGETK